MSLISTDVLQTLNNQMSTGVSPQWKAVFYSIFQSLQWKVFLGRASVALVFVVLNSPSSIPGCVFFPHSDLQEMKLIFHSICQLVVLQSSMWENKYDCILTCLPKILTLSLHKCTHFLTCFLEEEHVQSQMRPGERMSSRGRIFPYSHFTGGF